MKMLELERAIRSALRDQVIRGPQTVSYTHLVAALPAARQAQFAKDLAAVLDKEGVALDAASYRSAPPGLRIWCGATVEQGDLQALTPWLDWAFASCVSLLRARE